MSFVFLVYSFNLQSLLEQFFLSQFAHRTYGNLKTIRPNMALLGYMFVNKSMEWPVASGIYHLFR